MRCTLAEMRISQAASMELYRQGRQLEREADRKARCDSCRRKRLLVLHFRATEKPQAVLTGRFYLDCSKAVEKFGLSPVA